jgi:hypothetical protein
MIIDDSFVNLMKNFRRAESAFPAAPWDDALSEGQLASKKWLIDELVKINRDLGNVFVAAGWLGILPAMILSDERLTLSMIRCFDIDPECEPIAVLLNQHHQQSGLFKAFTADMFDIDYNRCSFQTQINDEIVPKNHYVHTVINTSCDHVTPFSRWFDLIPSGRLVILQNNDFADADETHTNTVSSLEEFKEQAPMRNLIFAGTLQTQKYKRFMLIGVK